MSTRTSTRVIRIQAKDETVPILLGITRTMGGMRREISALRTMLRLLADDEFTAALAAGQLGAMLQLAIPIIGLAAGLISMLVGVSLVQTRAAIPIGQTQPGQFRTMSSGGLVNVHAGEVIGRPSAPQTGFGGGGFSVNIAEIVVSPDRGMSDIQSGRFFRTMRDAYSSDVPMS